MAKKFIENTTAATMFVGGCMIPPGEGRDIEEMYLPPEQRSAAPAGDVAPPPLSQDELLEQLRAKAISAILPELAHLTNEALERLAELEGEQQRPRSTLIGQIEAERLRRANEALETERAAHRAAALATAEQRVRTAETAVAVADDATRADAQAALTEAQAALQALQAGEA